MGCRGDIPEVRILEGLAASGSTKQSDNPATDGGAPRMKSKTSLPAAIIKSSNEQGKYPTEQLQYRLTSMLTRMWRCWHYYECLRAAHQLLTRSPTAAWMFPRRFGAGPCLRVPAMTHSCASRSSANGPSEWMAPGRSSATRGRSSCCSCSINNTRSTQNLTLLPLTLLLKYLTYKDGRH